VIEFIGGFASIGNRERTGTGRIHNNTYGIDGIIAYSESGGKTPTRVTFKIIWRTRPVLWYI